MGGPVLKCPQNAIAFRYGLLELEEAYSVWGVLAKRFYVVVRNWFETQQGDGP
jgi:hypothetical protein